MTLRSRKECRAVILFPFYKIALTSLAFRLTSPNVGPFYGKETKTTNTSCPWGPNTIMWARRGGAREEAPTASGENHPCPLDPWACYKKSSLQRPWSFFLQETGQYLGSSLQKEKLLPPWNSLGKHIIHCPLPCNLPPLSLTPAPVHGSSWLEAVAVWLVCVPAL